MLRPVTATFAILLVIAAAIGMAIVAIVLVLGFLRKLLPGLQ